MKYKSCSESLDLARRIRAAGVAIHIEEDDCPTLDSSSDGLLIRLQGGMADSSVFDFSGGAGFALSLVLTCRLSMFAISAIELELPWTERVRWLEDPSEIDGSSGMYRFGGSSYLAFDRSQVLNHFLDVRRILPRGSSLKGYLLGIGTKPIPDHVRHGAMIPAFVAVFDQFGHAYRSTVSLWADRSEKLTHVHRPPKRRRLFDCPDRPVSNADQQSDLIDAIND